MPKTNESRWPILSRAVRDCAVVFWSDPPPPHIQTAVSSQLEKHKQENDPLHPLHEQDPTRKSLLLAQPSPNNTTQPLVQPQGIVTSRFEWGVAYLNRLRTRTGRCKVLMQKWGFNEDGLTACECGDEETMKHLLVCPILPRPCTHEDLEEFKPWSRSCAQHWAGVV